MYDFPTELIVCVAQNFHGHDWILYSEAGSTSEDAQIIKTIRWHCDILTFWNQFAGSVDQNRPVAFLMVGITTMTMTKMTMAMMMMDITVLAILMVGMGIIPLRAYYYPAESQIESPPDIQHAGDWNATNRYT